MCSLVTIIDFHTSGDIHGVSNIFDYNLSKNCPIIVIFGTLITQTVGKGGYSFNLTY